METYKIVENLESDLSCGAVMVDAAAVAVDIILARRAWDVVVRDNNRDDKGKGASGGGDDIPAEEGGDIIAETTTTWRRGGISLPERQRRWIPTQPP